MNKHQPCWFLFSFLVVMLAFGTSPAQATTGTHVAVIQLDGDTINPVTAKYIVEQIDRAEISQPECLIIKMDTPGGLLTSTRIIVKRMLTSKIPLVVYIAPDGSRAGSAGVFITYASHIAAMAPSTNIGAAHPVQLGGGSSPKKDDSWGELHKLIDELKSQKNSDNMSRSEEENDEKDTLIAADDADYAHDDNPMESKILEDTVAFIKSIAQTRNRNIEWAIESVVKSKSITATEALNKGVVEIIAKSDQDLLEQLDGRVIHVNGSEKTLHTKEARIEYILLDTAAKFFNVLADPNIVYFLMILGFYGLLYEITHPGFGIPGIFGAIFLILALYSMQSLPINYAGLALMILGLLLLVAEAFIPGFGIFAVGGLVSLILGSMLLFDSVDPVMQVSKKLILTFSFSTALITIFLIRLVLKSQRTKVQGGREGIIGEHGEARSDFDQNKKGKVFVHGELWNATSLDQILKNDEIIVTEINGLTLTVQLKKQEK